MFSVQRQSRILLSTLSLLWLIAKLVSWKVWLRERPLPIVPITDTLSFVPGWVHTSTYVISVTFLFVSIIHPSTRIYVIIFLSEIISCLLDQTRWQPWEYQYLFIVFAFLANHKKPEIFFQMLIIILASTYCYSGLSKLNLSFVDSVWRDYMLVRFLHIPSHLTHHYLVRNLGFAIGLFEVLCGVGLLFTWSRKMAAKALILMHVFILCFIGPLGLNYNGIVWPWNMTMIVFLYLIATQKQCTIKLTSFIYPANIIIILFWLVFPALSFWNKWDIYLSSHLYSGKSPDMQICIPKNKVPSELEKYKVRLKNTPCTDGVTIGVNRMYLGEMKVPCYPEKRVFKRLKEYLQSKYPKTPMQFFIKSGNRIEGF